MKLCLRRAQEERWDGIFEPFFNIFFPTVPWTVLYYTVGRAHRDCKPGGAPGDVLRFSPASTFESHTSCAPPVTTVLPPCRKTESREVPLLPFCHLNVLLNWSPKSEFLKIVSQGMCICRKTHKGTLVFDTLNRRMPNSYTHAEGSKMPEDNSVAQVWVKSPGGPLQTWECQDTLRRVFGDSPSRVCCQPCYLLVLNLSTLRD